MNERSESRSEREELARLIGGYSVMAVTPNGDAWLSNEQRKLIVSALMSSAPPSEIRPWLAFDVGCIECGESSAVIGTFSTKEEAESACEIAARKQEKEWHGQHSMEVFDLRVKEDQ